MLTGLGLSTIMLICIGLISMIVYGIYKGWM